MDGADKLSSPYNRAAPRWAAPPFLTVFAPVSRRVRFLQATQGVTPTWESERVLSRFEGKLAFSEKGRRTKRNMRSI